MEPGGFSSTPRIGPAVGAGATLFHYRRNGFHVASPFSPCRSPLIAYFHSRDLLYGAKQGCPDVPTPVFHSVSFISETGINHVPRSGQRANRVIARLNHAAALRDTKPHVGEQLMTWEMKIVVG